MKFSIKDFFSKCDQIQTADLVTFTEKKSIMENFIFYAVQCSNLGKSKSIYPRKFLFGQTANLAYSYNSKKEWINR